MEVKYNCNKDSLTLYVYGELDEYSASNAKDALDKVIYDNLNAKKVIFDLEKVSFMDSAGIGMILGRYKTAQMVGSTLNITNVKNI